MNAEAALAQYLEGKFFDTNGVDVNELKRRIRRERDDDKHMAERRRLLARERAAAYENLKHQRETIGNNAPRTVLAAVAYAHAVSVRDICSASRYRNAVGARMHVCFLLFNMGMSYSAIGRVIGRDHSTVLHACETWPKRVDLYPNEIAIADRELQQNIAA